MAGNDALDMSRSRCSSTSESWNFAEGHRACKEDRSGDSSPESPFASGVREKIRTFSKALNMTRTEVETLRSAVSALKSKFTDDTEWVSYHRALADASAEIKAWRDQVEDGRQQFIFKVKKELKEEILSLPLDEERLQKTIWPDMESLRVAVRRVEEKCEDVAQKQAVHSEEQAKWTHSISKIIESDRGKVDNMARKVLALETELNSVSFKLPGREHLRGGLAAQSDEVGAYMRSMHQESYEFRSSMETQVSSLSASLKQVGKLAAESQVESARWVSYQEDLAKSHAEIKVWRDQVKDDRQHFISRVKKDLKEELRSLPLDEERLQKAIGPDMESLCVAVRRVEEKCEDVAQKLAVRSEDQASRIHSISKIIDADRGERESTARRYDLKLTALENELSSVADRGERESTAMRYDLKLTALENELSSVNFKLPGREHLRGGLAAQSDEVGAYTGSMPQELYEFRSSLETQVSSLSASLKHVQTLAAESQQRLEAMAEESQLQWDKQIEYARLSDTMSSDLQEIRWMLEKCMAQQNLRDAQMQQGCITLEKLQVSQPTALVEGSSQDGPSIFRLSGMTQHDSLNKHVPAHAPLKRFLCKASSVDDVSVSTNASPIAGRLGRRATNNELEVGRFMSIETEFSSTSASQFTTSSDGVLLPHERSPSVNKSRQSPSPRGTRCRAMPVSGTASPSTQTEPQGKLHKVLRMNSQPSMPASQSPARTNTSLSPHLPTRNTMCKSPLSTAATPTSAHRR